MNKKQVSEQYGGIDASVDSPERRSFLTGTVATVGLAVSGLLPSQAEAQEIPNYLRAPHRTMQDANRAAQRAGMVLARDAHGRMRIVTPELAQMLQNQGFELDSTGLLRGYGSGQRLTFARHPIFDASSIEVQIESGSDSDRDYDTLDPTPTPDPDPTPDPGPIIDN
ncbi:twin-arginine translocation signal domain-containing protein [Candidatus Gracilibacteria bacterium]|nr:twin-arginine translocation signal domain-containing protein [Candidatus Gracilibacteria bacterium]